MTTKTQTALVHRIQVADAFINRKHGVTARMIEAQYDVAASTLQLWVRQRRAGLLTLSNAISVSHKPESVRTGEVYSIDGREFRTIDDCKKYAVEKLGGITVTRTVVEEIKL